MVLLTAYAASATLLQSQLSAARLAGGEPRLVLYACRHAGTPALLAAVLGGVLTLSDPGPGQILGLRTAAAEILTSFAVLHDFVQAGVQCAWLTAVVLLLAAPLAWWAAPRLAEQVLARQVRTIERTASQGMAAVGQGLLAAVVVGGTLVPLVGLVVPLVGRVPGEQVSLFGAVREGIQNGHVVLVLLAAASGVARTIGDTILYAVGAGTLAASLGILLACCVGRSDGLRRR